MPMEGFLALAFFPSPEFFFLTISWDLHFSIKNIYSWADSYHRSKLAWGRIRYCWRSPESKRWGSNLLLRKKLMLQEWDNSTSTSSFEFLIWWWSVWSQYPAFQDLGLKLSSSQSSSTGRWTYSLLTGSNVGNCLIQRWGFTGWLLLFTATSPYSFYLAMGNRGFFLVPN